MNKGTSDPKNGNKPTQKSIMSHFFGQKPTKAPVADSVESKSPEIVVIDESPKEDEIVESKVEAKVEETKNLQEDVKDLGVDSPAAQVSSPAIVTPSPPPAVPEVVGRRSSRIAVNAEAYAKAYYDSVANAPPESPPRRSKRSTKEDDEDEEYRERKASKVSSSSNKTASSSFFLSNKDKLALKEKEKQEKIRLEQERLDRLEAERQAQLLREAQERDQRIQEQLARTREENNRFFCMTTGEDGVVRQKQMVKNADGVLEEVEVTITSNPFFNARVAPTGSSANVTNLEEDSGDASTELGSVFSTVPACGSNSALQSIKSRGHLLGNLTKRLQTSIESDSFASFCGTSTLTVMPTMTSLDLSYLSIAFATAQDSRVPINPQYVTGSTPLNLRMMWLLYYSKFCGKFSEAEALVKGATSSAAPVTTASIFNNFMTPKIARPPSTTSLSSANTGVSSVTKAAVETVLIGNEETRQALQQWLEEWAGKHRTPKKQKNKGKTGKKSGKRGRRDEDYSSEDDAWDSDDDEEGLPNVLLLLGPSGSNKTATVYHYAKLLGYNVMEVNASMVRSRSNIQKMFSEGVQSQSLASAVDFSQFDGDEDDVRANGKKPSVGKSFLTNSGVKSGASGKSSSSDVSKKGLNLILFDELDVVFEEEDTHFHSSIVSLSKVSKCPIVLTSETLCPAFIRSCKPKLLRMYRPDAVQASSHLLTKYQNSTGVKPNELQVACRSILPLLCDGDLRSCQNTLTTISTKRVPSNPVVKTASSIVVDLCEASPAPKTVIDLEVMDLTGNSPKATDKKSSEATPEKVTEVSTEGVSPTAPLFGSFLAEHLQLDFAVFDHLGHVMTKGLTSSESSGVEHITVNELARRRYYNNSSSALVVPVVSAVEPRTMLSCDNTVIRIFGKHFLQRADASNEEGELTIKVMLNEICVKESVVVSDTVIAAVVPAKVFTAGVYSVVVKLSHTSMESHSIRSDVCGSAGGWILINDRVFKSLKSSAVVPNNGKNKKSSKPIAKTMDLFVFGAAPDPVAPQSPKASSGKRLQRAADKFSPSKKARVETEPKDDASVDTAATEDDELLDDDEVGKLPGSSAKQPVRRRLQVCDDEDDEQGNNDAQSVQSAGLTESTVDEKTAVSSDVVKEFSATLFEIMVELLRDLMASTLSDFNSCFVNAPIDSRSNATASAMDLTTVENMLLDKLYVKSCTFQVVTEAEFPDLDAFVQDVRSIWSNSLRDSDVASTQVLNACMMSAFFELSLQRRVDALCSLSCGFNETPPESLEAPLSVINSDGSLSIHLYNTPVGQVEQFTLFTNHAMYSEWLQNDKYQDLSLVNSQQVEGDSQGEMDVSEIPAPVTLEEYVPSREKLFAMLSESHASRAKLCASKEGTGVKVECGQEYTNEESALLFTPFKFGTSHAAPNDMNIACLDSLTDLSDSLDLLSSMDILNTRAVHYCNYADAYICPAVSSSSSTGAAANASITEVNNDFDSMYERFAVGGEEMYDHIPDEVMVNYCNTSNSSEHSECNFATYQRSGITLSDTSLIVQNGVLNLNNNIRAALMHVNGKSDTYIEAYKHHLMSYKHVPLPPTSSSSHKVNASKVVSTTNSRLNNKKRNTDYCSSDDDDDEDDEGVFIDEPDTKDAVGANNFVCSREELNKTLDSPYLSFMNQRLAVIRGVLTTLCHEEYGVFDNSNHMNTLCPAMALDLFPILVIMCRCEAVHDSADSNSYSVGRSSFTGGRRSMRGGRLAAPEKFVNLKMVTQLSEPQLEMLMNLMQWSHK